MNKTYLTILLIISTFLITLESQSQETKILRNCKVCSIEEVSFLPDYFVISIISEEKRIMLLSFNERSNVKAKKIKVDKSYTFELEIIDSILINQQDSSSYVRFGENGTYKFHIDGEGSLNYEDFNYKPYKPINLLGLKYLEIENNK